MALERNRALGARPEGPDYVASLHRESVAGRPASESLSNSRLRRMPPTPRPNSRFAMIQVPLTLATILHGTRVELYLPRYWLKMAVAPFQVPEKESRFRLTARAPKWGVNRPLSMGQALLPPTP